MFSNRFYKLNPICDAPVKTNLTTEGKIFSLGKIENQDDDLEIQIESVVANDYGKSIKLWVDDEMPQWDRRRGSFKTRYTRKVIIQIFEKEPIVNFISISGFKKADSLIKHALIKTVGEAPFNSVEFLLKTKQADIENKYPNVKIFKVKEIKDDHVKTAVLAGSFIEASAEYKKFAQNPISAGEIIYIGVPINNKLVFIMQDGSIYSRQVFSSDEELKEAYGIMKTISEVNATHIVV